MLLVDDERFARTVVLRLPARRRATRCRWRTRRTARSRPCATAASTSSSRTSSCPGADGLELLGEAKQLDPNIEVIVITALDRVDPAVRAMKSGASDYLVKPVTPEAAPASRSQRCLSTRALLAENKALRAHLQPVRDLAANHRHARPRTGWSHGLGALVARARRAAAPCSSSGTGTGSRSRPARRGSRHAAAADTRHGGAAPMFEALGGGAAAPPVERRGRRLPPPGGGRRARCSARCASRGAVLDAQALRTAEFLCRHLALALRNARTRLKQVEHLAYLDDLTHLYNTRFLDLVLDRELGARPAVLRALPGPRPLQGGERPVRSPLRLAAPRRGRAGAQILRA